MEIDNLIIEKIVSLDLEIRTREFEIVAYTSTLAELPTGDIPVELLTYVNIPVSEIPLSISEAELSLITQYKYRNYLETELRITKTEKEKAEIMRQSLYEQLPAETRDQLILDAATMLAAQQPT